MEGPAFNGISVSPLQGSGNIMEEREERMEELEGQEMGNKKIDTAMVLTNPV